MEEPIEVAAEVIEPTDNLTVVFTQAIIKDNITALDAYVDREIAPYIGAQIDPANEQQVKEARKCMADLNKLKAPIEDERKRIKKAYEAPLKEFEARVRAITSKIDSARQAIKEQVDEADARFREIRRATLEEEYVACVGKMADVIPFGAILEDAWLNRSTLEPKALSAVAERAAEALKGYKALQAQTLSHESEVMRHYANTLDLTSALELEQSLNAKDKELEEFRAAQEAANMAKPEPEPVPEQEPVSEPATDPDAPICRWALSMEFEGTSEFATQVGHTLKGMGITGATIKCVGVVS